MGRKVVPVSKGSSETTTETYMKNYKNVSQDIRDQLNVEAEAVQIILTWIDNDIYSTFDACLNACEMWKAIERLNQAESINVQDLETNLYWEFGKFTSRDESRAKDCLISQTLHQNKVNELRAERLAHTVNPLALVAQQQPVYHPQNHPTHYTQNSSTRSQQAATRNRGKAIVNSSLLIYDQEPSMVAEDDEMSKDKEIDKLMALISLSFKKNYKPTNNNLQTSSNTSRANQDNSLRITKALEHAHWRVDTDDESEDQELEAHYIEQIDQNDDDDDLANEHDLLASLIKKIKCEIDDSKNCCYNDNLALMLALESDKVIRLEKEIQSKLSDLIRPFDYKKLNNLYDLFVRQHEKASAQRYFSKRPQLKSNPIEDKVMLKNSQGKKQEVEDHRRNVKFSKNKTSVTACNYSLNTKTSNVNFVYATCGKCVLNEKHDMCVLKPRNGVNSRTKIPMVMPVSSREPKRIINQSVAKPLRRTVASESTNRKPKNTTRKLYEHVTKTCSWWYPKFTPPGYNWKPESKIGNVNLNVSMPLGNTSRTANILEPMTSSVPMSQILHCVLFLLQLVEIILFIVDYGCSKHMTGNLKLLINFVEKFPSTVKFRNDQIAPILGYGDLVQGAVMIKRVYYVKGLNHNLFFVGQLCDVDLEVAFWNSTCYICDLKGNDLLTGTRGTDLYSITLQYTSSPNPICLMAKATSSQAWLWHRRLSHLNFDSINLLIKNDIVIGHLKLKFFKDHLCSSCELGKAKRKSFQTKITPSSKKRIQLLHMDFCGPMRVASINGKKYVLEKTPYHIINDQKLSVKFFHIFGSLCYIVRDGENLNKMKEKGDACIFVGYSTQSRAYMVFNKRTRVIVETIHVNFDELPHMASDHVSFDPVPQSETVTMSNELDLLFGLMFAELLNGSTKVMAKSFAETTADATNQCQQQHTTLLNTQTTPGLTCQVPTQALTVTSTENINQA
nr:hypothetical protein [Tanacetum cinerariifolium]